MTFSVDWALNNNYLYIYICVQQTPRLGGASGSKGKGTDDPIRFLPVLPSKRSKPSWEENPPSFILSGQVDKEQPDIIDLIGELTASELRWEQGA